VNSIQLRDGFSVARSQARDRIESTVDLKQLFRAIDSDPAIVGVAVTTGVTFKLVGVAKSSRQVLSGLNRQERRKLTSELLLIKDPRITPKLLKLKQAAGELPKRFTPVQLKRSTNIQVADCLSTIPDVAGSMMSGVLHAVGIGIYQEVTDE
jgi:hypothetical protein